MILVYVGPDAGLFFTKINGVLKVDAYRWQDKNPGTRFFTGNIIVYSFQTKTINGLVYNNSDLIKKGSMYLPPVPVVGFVDKMMLSDVWSLIESYRKQRSHH